VAGKYAPLLKGRLFSFPEFRPSCTDVWQDKVASTLRPCGWSIFIPQNAGRSVTWQNTLHNTPEVPSHGQMTLQGMLEALRSHGQSTLQYILEVLLSHVQTTLQICKGTST